MLYCLRYNYYAEVMELADVPDSKSGGSNTVWVQIPPSAPIKEYTAGVLFLLGRRKRI